MVDRVTEGINYLIGQRKKKFRERYHRRSSSSRSNSKEDHRKSNKNEERKEKRDRSLSETSNNLKKSNFSDSTIPPEGEITCFMILVLNMQNKDLIPEHLRALGGQHPSLQQNKVDRQLYIGNIPPGITVAQLIELLNSALLKISANTQVTLEE